MVFSILNFTRDSLLAPFGLLGLSQTFFFEIIDMIIMALAIGYIFSGFIRKPIPQDHDPLTYYKKSQKWENIKFAALAAGPAVVVHELAHKFVAMSFGAKAILYAPYGFYLLIVLLSHCIIPNRSKSIRSVARNISLPDPAKMAQLLRYMTFVSSSDAK